MYRERPTVATATRAMDGRACQGTVGDSRFGARSDDFSSSTSRPSCRSTTRRSARVRRSAWVFRPRRPTTGGLRSATDDLRSDLRSPELAGQETLPQQRARSAFPSGSSGRGLRPRAPPASLQALITDQTGPGPRGTPGDVPVLRSEPVPERRPRVLRGRASSRREPHGRGPEGPKGRRTASLLVVIGLYPSQHHSQTFPCMSYRPQAFGRFWPTGCVW